MQQEYRKQYIMQQLRTLGITKVKGLALEKLNYRVLLYELAKERAKRE